MTASSVTGIGQGSAEGASKGSEHMSLGVGRLIGPHFIAVGTGTVGGGGSVTLGIPVDSSLALADMAAIVTVNMSTAHAISYTMTLDTTTSVLSLVVHGTASDVFSYAIVRVGQS